MRFDEVAMRPRHQPWPVCAQKKLKVPGGDDMHQVAVDLTRGYSE